MHKVYQKKKHKKIGNLIKAFLLYGKNTCLRKAHICYFVQLFGEKGLKQILPNFQ